MALNKDQVKVLEGMPGIDQTLLGTYKKNNPGSNPSATINAPKEEVGGDMGVDRITKFNAALNSAIGQAREQRKDSVLDMVGGMIPTGSLQANSFASVLNAFNNSAAPIEATLLNNANDFAVEQEKRKEDIKTEIRDLALKVGQAGGSQDTVNAIAALIASGDIDAAVKIAATGLAKKGVTKTGTGLTDKEGNPIWEISNTSLWDSGKQGPIWEVSKFNDEFNNTKVTSGAELKTEMDRLLKDNFVKISTALKNDTTRRDFMNDWVEYQEMVIGGPVDPMVYMTEWAATNGIELTKPKSETTKTEESKDLYSELYESDK